MNLRALTLALSLSISVLRPVCCDAIAAPTSALRPVCCDVIAAPTSPPPTAPPSPPAHQPYGACWHPDDIRDWTPQKFPDNKYNRAKLPLQQRFREPQPMRANPSQWYEGQVTNATILYPMCSQSPAQGAANFVGYQPTYWQYMDKLVYWAGSASEGIINCPPAGSIDAAHQSGVKVLGNIFFPPAAYGGNQAWVRQLLTQHDGHYVYAQKLYEIAHYMGFDGWFINEESGGGTTEEWVAFIREFNAAADAAGDTLMEIQWYDASATPNVQILASHPNTSQFTEYGSVGDRRSFASRIGCTEEQVFSKIYGGVQCVSSGLTGYGNTLRAAFPKNGHVGSVDLFCPEEHVWRDQVKSILTSSTNNHGPAAYAAMEQVFQNENRMWTNENGDPSVESSGTWPGLSGCVLERSAITELPFVSTFCVGIGKHRFVDGQPAGSGDWWHSGMQSILPTWRYWIENRGALKVSIDWDKAWAGGNSLLLSGSLTAGDHLWRLYKTQLNIPQTGAEVELIYQTTAASAPQLILSTASSTTPDTRLEATTTETLQEGWKRSRYDLSALKGKTVYMLALNINDGEQPDYSLHLGRMAVVATGYAPQAVAVNNLQTESTLGAVKNDLRLTWDYDWTPDFDHFDIYLQTEDGQRTLAGQTRDEGYYIPTFERWQTDATLRVELVTVMKDGRSTKSGELTLSYPAPTAPIVSITPSKSYIRAGETVTLSGRATGNATAWQWELPDGLALADGSTVSDNPISVKALKTGRMVVTLRCSNTVGTSVTTVEALDVMDDAGIADVYNVVEGKTVVGYSGSTNSTEVPGKIIDGVTSPTQTSAKWCNVSSDNWVVFDCEGAYRIYGFRIYDGNSGPEKGVDQIDSYRIELSTDGEQWTTVVDEENREQESIKTDYICPVKARYVRLTPHVNGTLRIWEFQVFGRNESHLTATATPQTLRMTAGGTAEVSVNYDLNGDSREEPFYCEASSQNGYVGVGEIAHTDGCYTLPLTAIDIMGTDVLTIKVFNGGAYTLLSVDVTIDATSQPNVLSGLDATLRKYAADYAFEAPYTDFTVATLTDGDTTSEGCTVIEDYSVHKDDVWAIFEAPDGTAWDLSKVRVCLPNSNRGENDNGSEGYVNRSISIAVGDDLSRLTRVKTFESLQDADVLEYIFPQYQTTHYLAIICDLNAYFYASLAEVEAYEQVGSQVPVYSTIQLSSGWNADVVGEKMPPKDYVNNSIDGNGGIIFTNATDGRGISKDGKVTLSTGTTVQLQDFAADNAILVSGTTPVVAHAQAAEGADVLHFIAIGRTAGTLHVAINYADGTQHETRFDVPRWDDGEGNSPTVWKLLDVATYKMQNLYVYDCTMTHDDARAISSFEFSAGSGEELFVIAVSKKWHKGESSMQGIVSPFLLSPLSSFLFPLSSIYGPDGKQRGRLQHGLNLVRDADGVVHKVWINNK